MSQKDKSKKCSMVQSLLAMKEFPSGKEIDFILQRTIVFFGMGKKMKDESLEKIRNDESNK